MSNKDKSSQPKDERKEKVPTMSENQFLYTKRTSDVELDKEWYTISETVSITQLSPVWVRRQVKQKKFEKTRFHDGKWYIHRDSILDKLSYLQEKDERLEKRSRGEITSGYQVPSLKSCDIIERRIKEDSELDDDTRDLFLSRIDSYRQYFTERLDKIRKERK